MQDDDLTSHFIKNNLLKPIIDVFVANGNRYNLLNSAVLDLFEYIRKVSIFLTTPLFFGYSGRILIQWFCVCAGKSEIFS